MEKSRENFMSIIYPHIYFFPFFPQLVKLLGIQRFTELVIQADFMIKDVLKQESSSLKKSS